MRKFQMINHTYRNALFGYIMSKWDVKHYLTTVSINEKMCMND